MMLLRFSRLLGDRTPPERAPGAATVYFLSSRCKLTRGNARLAIRSPTESRPDVDWNVTLAFSKCGIPRVEEKLQENVPVKAKYLAHYCR
jgi:hypothetical protein